MVRVGSFPLLVALAAAAWAIPAYEALRYGAVSVLSAVTAAMFTVMVVAWPLLVGRRLSHGRAERAVMCRDCRSLRWPNELAFGFCIHCGSARPPVPVTY